MSACKSSIRKSPARNLPLAACVVALAAALGPIGTGPAKAAGYAAGTLEISAPWARATPQGAAAGAAYLTVTNKGQRPMRLDCLSSEAAAQCHIHQVMVHDGVAQMRPVAGGVQIGPGETLTLKPGGYHIMLEQLKHPLQQGKTVAATLQAGDGATVVVQFPIAAAGAPAPGAAPRQ